MNRHVLGLSGGKDSAALAIYMSQNYPDLEIDYFFTDTGEELPEVYEFLNHLEGFLGKPIKRLNSGRDFKFYLKLHNGFLPAPHARWCTIKMKLEPFKKGEIPSSKKETLFIVMLLSGLMKNIEKVIFLKIKI